MCWVHKLPSSLVSPSDGPGVTSHMAGLKRQIPNCSDCCQFTLNAFKFLSWPLVYRNYHHLKLLVLLTRDWPRKSSNVSERLPVTGCNCPVHSSPGLPLSSLYAWVPASLVTTKSPAITKVNYIFHWLKLCYLKGKTMHSEVACAALIHVCTQYGTAQPLIIGSLTLFSIIGAKEARKEGKGEKWK